MTEQTKRRSSATINPTPEQQHVRNVGRVKTLMSKLEEAKAMQGTDREFSSKRVASLKAELDRRVIELRKAQDSTAALLASIDA